MRQLKNNTLIFLVGFFLMLIDGHLSELFSDIAGRSLLFQVHLLIIFLFFFIRYSENDLFLYISMFALGLIYDSYYLNFVGIAFFMLPIVVTIIRKWGAYFVTLPRRLLAFLILMFIYDSGSYGLAFLYHLTTYNPLQFVTYQLLGTMILNLLIFLIIDRVLHRNSAK